MNIETFCSGVCSIRMGAMGALLGVVRQGAARAHACVPHAAEGTDVRVRQTTRVQGDVRRRGCGMRVSFTSVSNELN